MRTRGREKEEEGRERRRERRGMGDNESMNTSLRGVACSRVKEGRRRAQRFDAHSPGGHLYCRLLRDDEDPSAVVVGHAV